MAYYLTAHRNGRKINLPIEDKHWYKLGVQNADYYDASAYKHNETIKVLKPNLDPSVTESNSTQFGATTRGTCTYNNNGICLLFAGSTFGLEDNGTQADDEFIGDKIYLKRICYTISITPNISFYNKWKAWTYDKLFEVNYKTEVPTQINTIGVSDSSPSKPFSMNLRLMLVKFNDPLVKIVSSVKYGDIDGGLLKDDALVNTNTNAVKDMLGQWFNQSRIYIDASSSYIANNENDQNLNECYQPLYTDMLRDSCPWTGKYKILWDEKIKWDGKPMFFNKTFTINKNVNLQKYEYQTVSYSTNHVIYLPTNETLQNTYLFIMGPAALSTDLSPELYQFMNEYSTSAAFVADVKLNTKVTYYDI